MKILVTSDWHADAFTAGVRRYDDICVAVNITVEAAIREKVDAYAFLGDLCDPDEGAFPAIRLAQSALLRLKQHEIDSFWLTGNHDVIEDAYGTHTLLPLTALTQNVINRWFMCDLREPRTTLSPVWLIALPYVATSVAYSPVEVLEWMRGKIPANARIVVLSHLMIEGIEPGSETINMRRGRDIFLPVERLFELFQNAVVCNGHYHRSQTFKRVHIPGDLVRLNQNEIDNVPGYLIVEV